MDAALCSLLSKFATHFAPGRRVIQIAGRKRAAVLAPLLSVDGEPAILFTVRTGSVGTHKHQVSFPGGHLEAGEGPAAAAVRECREEVGLVAEVLGEHDDVIAVTGTLVTPVLGHVAGHFTTAPGSSLVLGPGLSANAAEVGSTFALPLAHLLLPGSVVLETHTPPPQAPGGALRRSIVMPVFSGGPQPVWGLTAVILAGLLSDIVIPAWEEAGRPLHPGARAALSAAAEAAFASHGPPAAAGGGRGAVPGPAAAPAAAAAPRKG